MNDTTYLATILDAHRADDLRREIELRAQHAERQATAPRPAAEHASVGTTAVAASVLPARRAATRHHRSARRTTSVATR